MRAALYIRVSTEEQAKEGFSIPAQLDQLTRFAESEGWQIVDTYIDDGYSAKDTNRPEMQRMLQDIRERKIQMVLVAKLDRLTRSVRDLYELLDEFERYGCSFYSRQERFDLSTPMGRAALGMMGIFAQWERETIAERVRMGMEQMVREGKRPGAPKPFGYDSDGNIIKEEAEILHEMRRLYMKGHGMYSVAQILNRQGKYHRGAIWTQQYVKYCLENPYYIGYIRWGKDSKHDEILVKGDHEPIWTQEEYDLHMRRMEIRSGKNYTKKFTYWFTGVLRCGRCGEALIGRRHFVKRKRTRHYELFNYRCSGRNNGTGCKLPTLRQDLIEKLVLEYVEKYRYEMSNVETFARKYSEEQQKKQQSLEDVKRELDKVQERIRKWQRMCVNELITEDELREYLAEEREQERQLKEKLSSLKQDIQFIPQRLYSLPDLWPDLDDNERHELIITIFKKIVVNAPDEKIPPKGKYRNAYIQSVEYN